MKNLLLFSNSRNHGEGWLDYAMPALRRHIAGVRRLAFVPFAVADRGGYVGMFRERLAGEGIGVEGVTPDDAGAALVAAAEGIAIGGGNTWRLLDTLQRASLIEPIRRRALAGTPYFGWSAGSGVAAPTIRTTNDMPIVQPRTFDALGLIPFQINAHYMDADPASTHMGETREERLLEYLEENAVPVIGLREGTWLRVGGDSVVLEGRASARIFRRGAAPFEVPSGSELTEHVAR